MTGVTQLRWRAGFVATPSGPRYYTGFSPPAATAARGDAVFLPPLAEELNKSRRMFALAARRLAAAGWHVHSLDLFGCGDSPGQFERASWTGWVEDLAWIVGACRPGEAGSCWLWALRAGALFVPELIARFPATNLLLWQPALNGQQQLQQFLRLRTAASAIGTQRASAESPRALLARGESVEVAGYLLPPDIARGVEAAELSVPTGFAGRVAWFEVQNEEPPSLVPAGAKLRLQWMQSGVPVHAEAVNGLPFWLTQEIAECPALIERTLALLDQDPPGVAQARAEPSLAFIAGEVAPQCTEEFLPVIEGDRQLGAVLSRNAGGAVRAGVLIIVGGPQYRIGSHRQFVALARRLAAHGFPTLRFDLFGMGDSDGDLARFDRAGDDVAMAIDALERACGEGTPIVVFGLCDGASAALLFAADDPRIRGLALANPWVRSEASLASTHLRHYYWRRIADADFWRKLARGQLDWRASATGFLRAVCSIAGRWARPQATDTGPFQTRMATGWRRFPGRILLVLSGRDLTAQEFLEYAGTDAAWRGLVGRANVERVELPESDHTFSRSEDQSRFEQEVLRWLLAVSSSARPPAPHNPAAPAT